MPRIHPDASVWPANTLRFHVAFGQAMDVDRAMRHVRLERARPKGAFEAVEGALVDLVDGLWTADQRVMTVLLHPGRVKAGLAAHDAMGRAIVPGWRHRVVVDGAIETADGASLGAPVVHAFLGGEAVTTAVPLERTISYPVRADTTETIRIDAARPLDVLATAATTATDACGREVGVRAVATGFGVEVTTSRAWPADRVTLRFPAGLEDCCGNRIGQAFEAPAPAGRTGHDRRARPCCTEPLEVAPPLSPDGATLPAG